MLELLQISPHTTPRNVSLQFVSHFYVVRLPANEVNKLKRLHAFNKKNKFNV